MRTAAQLMVLFFATGAAAQARPPHVALLVSPHGEGHTTLHVQRADAPELSAAVARLEHTAGAPLRGVLLPGGQRVAVVTDLARPRDLSFSGSLVVLEPGVAPRVLVDRVAHATAPHVTADGRLLVQRGEPGLDDAGGRVDTLAVDEVDPRTGRVRTVARFRGFTAFIAGSLGQELFLYRVGPGGADVVSLDLRSLEVRVLAKVPPFARDFTVDAHGRALVFTNRDPVDPGRWRVVRLPAGGGEPEVLAESRSMAMIPFAWPDGTVTFNAAGGLFAAGDQRRAVRIGAPGQGLQTIRAVTRDGAWAVVLQAPEGGGVARRPWLWSAAMRAAIPVAAPLGARIEVAGFVPEQTR